MSGRPSESDHIARRRRWHDDGMEAPADTVMHRLVVTGPERDRLYQHFSRLFWGRVGVEVVKDRRVAERRRSSSQSAVERRTRERRRAAPDWVFPPS